MQPQTPRKRWFGSLRELRFRGLELSPTKRRLRKGVSVSDLRAIAKRRLPRGVFDYIDGGAEDELALRSNSEAYRRMTFRPRVLRDVSEVDTSSSLLGKPLPYPLVLAPTGFTRIADPAGELAVARAAAARRASLFAVDPGDPVDRGGGGGQLGPAVVPGVRVEGPGPGRRDGAAGGGLRLRGALSHCRHRRVW